MKQCKHPIKSLKISSRYHSSPDGYGGDNEWNWYVFECTNCQQEVKVKDESTCWHLGGEEYKEVTGRVLDYSEIKKLFLKNKDIYNHADIPQYTKNELLTELGFRTPELGKKIKAKQKLIKKHKEELRQMGLTYYGGELPYLWEYS